MPRPLRILVVCPAPAGSRVGNRVTALRWRRVLRSLGHRVRIVTAFDDRDARCDLLVALHARKSSDVVARARAARPKLAIVVALTGTDLYRDLPRNRAARRSLEIADRLVVLHPNAARDLPRDARNKARFVPQSSPRISATRRPQHRNDPLRVLVIGHLRPIKDPFRIVGALRFVPRDVGVKVVHVGRALSDTMRRTAISAMRRDDRYRWIGERSPAQTRRALARADLLVLTSRAEGGANVLSEAIAANVPIVASRIPSSVGILGRRHPGWFPVGDARALASMLVRCARDPHFLDELRASGAARRTMLSPNRERSAWRALLREIAGRTLDREVGFRPRAAAKR